MPQKDFEVMGHVVLQRILVGVLGVASSMLTLQILRSGQPLVITWVVVPTAQDPMPK